MMMLMMMKLMIIMQMMMTVNRRKKIEALTLVNQRVDKARLISIIAAVQETDKLHI